MTKEKRLGRGLEALLGRVPSKEEQGTGNREQGTASRGAAVDQPYGAFDTSYGMDLSVSTAAMPVAAAEPQPEARPAGPERLPVAELDGNPFQPRQEFDEAEIASLAESLQAHGLLQPIVVRRVEDGYQIVAGERRLRAAVKAGWSDVPVQIIEADDRQMAELAIVENLHRKDLNALEKARSFQRYLEQYRCTQEELASRLKLDRSTISNMIRLLELPDAVQRSLREGKITQGHARSLLPLGDEREQVAFAERIQREGLSVRQTEAMVQEMIDQADAEPLALVDRDGTTSKARRASDHVAGLEQDFRAALGMKVKLSSNARGRGKLVIQFANHEEFERLRAHICGTEPKSQAG